MNVLFSTTRQWNPGDEFIMMGCINLLKAAGLTFNPVIYNRNPQVRPKGKFNRYKKLDKLIAGGKYTPFLDNSWKDSGNPASMDLLVQAGSPEWRGKRMTDFYELMNRYNKPLLVMGIGSARKFEFDLSHFPEHEMKALSSARLVTCRDTRTAEGLKDAGAQFIPCPALFSAPDRYEHSVTKVRKIGLIYGTDKAVANNNVSSETFQYLKSLYSQLMAKYPDVQFEFVAHYIDELDDFNEHFPDQVLRYSYDSKDYLDIYGEYDLVIGHRVHGIGISASQGIPGVAVSHDLRGETARGFGAHMVLTGDDLTDVMDAIDERINNIEAVSKEILEHKHKVRSSYLELLKPALAEWL